MNRPCFGGTRSIDVMYLTQYDALGGNAPAPYASPRHLAEPVSLGTNQQMAACVQLESRLSRVWRFSNRGMSAADTTGNPVKSADYRGERMMIVALKQSHKQAEGCPLRVTWNLYSYPRLISSGIFMVACVIVLKHFCPPGARDDYLPDNGPFSGVTGLPMVPHRLIVMVRSGQAPTAVQTDGDACVML